MPLSCPNCRRQLTVPNAKPGLQISCPGCQRTFVLGKPAPKAIAKHDNIAEYDVQQEPKDRVLREVGPPNTTRPQATAKATKLATIEASCLNCGYITIFDATFGGQRGECHHCGDGLLIPTIKQNAYRLSQRRFWRRYVASLLLIIGSLIAGLVGLTFYLSYREGQTPPGAARQAWAERIQSSPMLRELVNIDYEIEEASNGELTIFRIYASSRQKSKKLKLDISPVHADGYVVMRGLTVIETVFTDGASLDELKKKHGIK